MNALVTRTPDIVYAVVDRVEPGRVAGGPDPEDALRSITFVLRVEEVLQSERFQTGDQIPVSVGGTYLQVNIGEEYGAAVGDEGLFFLIRMGAPQPQIGFEGNPKDFALNLYTFITPSQGAFINDRGRVFVEYPFEDQFPANLNGIPFEELIERVRAAMQS